MSKTSKHWFHNGVLYQIYPRSFKDSNGNGIGDFQGIIQKLPYLNGEEDSLGITAIWLSPFYPSPMADFGYDVTDYCDVDPLFGTLEDFRNLLEAAHDRDIRVLIDLIPGHTSDEHKWFQESLQSKDNPYRDWYVWRDPKPDGSEPNNWLSHFGGSAWKFDEHTGQYYLHSFLDKQPDLNWENPKVREAIKNVMRFWLDIGVDGFRVDWVVSMSKDPEFRDEELNPNYDSQTQDEHNSLTTKYCQGWDELFPRLDEFAEVLAQYPDKFMVTEAYPEKTRKASPYIKFYERINPTVSAPFFFAGLFTPWSAKKFRKFINAFQKKLKKGYVAVYSWSNHDQSRPATRFGPEQARALAVMSLTLPGVPMMYYGDELGMKDVEILPEQVRDTFEKNCPGRGFGRDPQRTPFQWDKTSYSGFSDVEPWLPVSPDYETCNLEVQRNDTTSMFSLYKKLIAIRKENAVLRTGAFESVKFYSELDDKIFVFKRSKKNKTFIVLINFSTETLEIPALDLQGKIIISTHNRIDLEVNNSVMKLAPHEGMLIELQL